MEGGIAGTTTAGKVPVGIGVATPSVRALAGAAVSVGTAGAAAVGAAVAFAVVDARTVVDTTITDPVAVILHAGNRG